MILTFKQVSTHMLPFLFLKNISSGCISSIAFLEIITLEDDVKHDRINCAQKKNPQKGVLCIK